MEQATKQALQIFATKARMGVLDGVYHAKAGHPGGSLSICDVLSYLYNVRMHVEPKDPKMPGRDRLVLSKGHAAPALYAALALKGFFRWKISKRCASPTATCRATRIWTRSPAWI